MVFSPLFDEDFSSSLPGAKRRKECTTGNNKEAIKPQAEGEHSKSTVRSDCVMTRPYLTIKRNKSWGFPNPSQPVRWSTKSVLRLMKLLTPEVSRLPPPPPAGSRLQVRKDLYDSFRFRDHLGISKPSEIFFSKPGVDSPFSFSKCLPGLGPGAPPPPRAWGWCGGVQRDGPPVPPSPPFHQFEALEATTAKSTVLVDFRRRPCPGSSRPPPQMFPDLPPMRRSPRVH